MRDVPSSGFPRDVKKDLPQSKAQISELVRYLQVWKITIVKTVDSDLYYGPYHVPFVIW